MSDSGNMAVVGTSLTAAAAALRRGGIVAFPTETYYGLGVDPDNRGAVERLFRIKRRSPDKPLLLLIDNQDQLQQLVAEVPPQYQVLMTRHWPGPLTLIFPAKPVVSELVAGSSGTIGLRISSHPLARELVRIFGKPITATSANISGLSPGKSAAEVAAMFGSGLDYILDGGETAAGLCSTIVAVRENSLQLVRRGQIDLLVETGQDDGATDEDLAVDGKG